MNFIIIFPKIRDFAGDRGPYLEVFISLMRIRESTMK